VEIRPIRTEADYEAAIATIERLFDAPPGTPEADLLEVWTTLVEAYEEKRYPVPPPDPIAAIQYHLESRGLADDDLLPYLGSRARVREVMSCRRPLTLTMIRRLNEGLGIPADLLIRPYPLVASVA